jgi:DNA adenine methylase
MTEIKPFLQWAGGKHCLIPVLQKYLPPQISGYDTYIEPFVGAGAMALYLLANKYRFRKVIINDVNARLMNTYRVIRQQPCDLLERLEKLSLKYSQYSLTEDRKSFFLEQRNAYNNASLSPTEYAALFIFLNKTCFNGLFRVNAKNEFNVSFGKGKGIMLFCKKNIMAVHHLLQGTEICSGDYAEMLPRINSKTFIYLDPPYYPGRKSAGFCSYSAQGFDSGEQIRLADFCKSLSCKWLISNSDTGFISNLYADFHIYKIATMHFVKKYAKVTELLITNY